MIYFVDPIQEPWKKSDEYKKLRKALYRYQYALAGSILVFVMLMFILASFLVSDTFNTCPKPIDVKVNHSNHYWWTMWELLYMLLMEIITKLKYFVDDYTYLFQWRWLVFLQKEASHSSFVITKLLDVANFLWGFCIWQNIMM